MQLEAMSNGKAIKPVICFDYVAIVCGDFVSAGTLFRSANHVSGKAQLFLPLYKEFLQHMLGCGL